MPEPEPFKTLDARPDTISMIKPGEMIDVIEMSPLTLSDRRIYNMLIENAWERIDQPVTHTIEMRAIRGTRDANDRVGESVERLMSSIARLEIEINGRRCIRRVQLLGDTDEDKDDEGLLYYRFPPGLRAIIRKSRIFARLRKDVIFALSSKYALALYELCEKRVNLGWIWQEEFTVERFRQLLGVDPDKLKAFKNLNQKAIQPAVAEVNFLSDFGCSVEPVLAGRKVIKVRLSWWKKNIDELKTAYRELQSAKVGRRSRIKGTVEMIMPTENKPTLKAPRDP
jgi:Initiator Replication protein